VQCVDGLRGRGVGVGGEGSPAVFTVAASAAAVASALSKVFLGLLLRSQVGWGVDDIVLACSVILLSSRGCAAWCFLISCGTCTLLTGSQVLSLSGYPFHLIRYWSLRRRC